MTIPRSPTVPHTKIHLPSGLTVTARPFLVEEEMILLHALESRSEEQMMTATEQVLGACIIEPKNLKIAEMAYFDVDYMLIKMKGISVGTDMKVKFHCNNVVDGKPCNHDFDVEFDIDELKFTEPSKNNQIELGDGIGVVMRYPSFYAMRQAMYELDDKQQAMDLVVDSIEKIFDKETVYSDMTDHEKVEWVNHLTKKHFDLMGNFVNQASTVYFETEHQCPSCGFDHRLEYNDFSGFFT